jgi:hypothetical protein
MFVSIHLLWGRGLYAARFAGLALTASLLAVSLPGTAAADNLWLVMQVDVGARTAPASAAEADKLEQQLRARGLDVIDGTSAAGEFARRHSRVVAKLPPEQIAKLDGALRELADYLASENVEQARGALQAIERLSPDVRDQLNHDTQRARRRFHTCLLAAHLFSKEGDGHQSFEQLRKCARDFPGLAPEQSQYLPESMRTFFAEAERELRAIRPASLHVDVEHGRDPSCHARVNGIDRGPVAVTVDEIRTERVRVQVDCGGVPGRVYEVALEPGDNTIRIDPLLDRAIRTAPSLGLSYRDETTAANNRLLHSLRVARAVGADSLIQIWNGELHRIEVPTRSELVAASDGVPIERQLDALLAGPGGAGALQPSAAENSDSAATSPFTTLAWISAGAAVLAGTGTFVAWRVREGAVDRFNDMEPVEPCTTHFDLNATEECAGYLSTADSAETAMWALSFAGIGLAALATTFFAIDARRDHDAAATSHACSSGPGDLGVACTFRF